MGFPTAKRAIGIDPGLAATGFAVVETMGKGGHACEWGGIRTSSRTSTPCRLCRLFDELTHIMERWVPDLMVVEDVFMVDRFPQTAIQLGEVLGVISLAAWKQNIPIAEITMYPQNTVKLEGRDAERMLRLMEALEDGDDVQKVYANFDIPDSVMEELSAA